MDIRENTADTAGEVVKRFKAGWVIKRRPQQVNLLKNGNINTMYHSGPTVKRGARGNILVWGCFTLQCGCEDGWS